MIISDLNRRFEYTADRIDNWRIMDAPNGTLKGDCDDYAVTALWILSGDSMARFWLSLWTGEAQLWRCKTASGAWHMTLKYRGHWIDNIYLSWSEEPRHTLYPAVALLPRFLRFPFWGPLAMFRMGWSRVVRIFAGRN